jgi:hypothetical protein
MVRGGVVLMAERRRPEICKPIRSHSEHDDGNSEGRNLLLEERFSTHGYEYVENIRCQDKQLAILYRRPPM